MISALRTFSFDEGCGKSVRRLLPSGGAPFGSSQSEPLRRTHCMPRKHPPNHPNHANHASHERNHPNQL